MKLIQKGLALLLTLCLLTSGALAAGYSDVEGTAEAGDVAALAELGLMNGVGGGRFAPDAPMTRAMLATTLFRLAGEREEDYADVVLSDVAAEAWYAPAALWAWQTGVAVGGVETFDPEGTVTAAEALGMLCRYTGDFTSDPLAWGEDLYAALPAGDDTLTRAQAAALLLAFAKTQPSAPLTMGKLSATASTCGALADRYGGYRYTYERTLYADGGVATQDGEILTFLPAGSVEHRFLPGDQRSLFYADAEYIQEADGGAGMVVQSPEVCKRRLEYLRDLGPITYAPQERITGIAVTEDGCQVSTLVFYEGGSTTSLYTVEPDSLRLVSCSSRDLDEAGVCFGEVLYTPYYGEVSVDAAFITALKEPGGASTRVCTLITDPGTEMETTETYTVPQGCHFYYYDVEGYRYFEDAAGTVPMEWGKEPIGDVTTYLLPAPAVETAAD